MNLLYEKTKTESEDMHNGISTEEFQQAAYCSCYVFNKLVSLSWFTFQTSHFHMYLNSVLTEMSESKNPTRSKITTETAHSLKKQAVSPH